MVAEYLFGLPKMMLHLLQVTGTSFVLTPSCLISHPHSTIKDAVVAIDRSWLRYKTGKGSSHNGQSAMFETQKFDVPVIRKMSGTA